MFFLSPCAHADLAGCPDMPGPTKVDQECCRVDAKATQHGYNDTLDQSMMTDERIVETSDDALSSSRKTDRMVYHAYVLAVRVCVGALLYAIGYVFGYGVGFTTASSPDLDIADAPQSWTQTV